MEFLKENHNTEIEEPLNIDQAAKFLHKSKSALYTAVCRRKLRAHKFGGQLYFFRSELIQAIRQNQTGENFEK